MSQGMAGKRLLLCRTKPEQAVENKAVLDLTVKSGRELFVGLMLVIDVIVAHVEINHSVALIGPNDRVITFVPDFMWFRTGSQRITGRID